MISLKYSYFVACLIFLVPWIYFYQSRSDLRKAMVGMSLIGGIASLIMAYFWTADWWLPITITGTRIGIEDFLLGFSNAGIASVIYPVLFNRSVYKFNSHSFIRSLIILSLASFLVFWAMHSLFDFNSFTAWIISATSYSAAIVYIRRDLLKPSLINGLLMVLVVAPIYYLSKIISPDALKTFYVFPLQPDIKLASVPIQEFVFYFVFGCMIPLVYEYWHGLKLRKQVVIKSASRV